MSRPGITRPVLLPLRRSSSIAHRTQHIIPLSSQCLHQHRDFSTSPALRRHKRKKTAPVTPNRLFEKMTRQQMALAQVLPQNIGALKTLSTHTKQMHDSGRLPNDLGLLPGTFIPPTGAARPSLFKNPGLVLRMDAGKLWKRTRDFISVLAIKFMGGRPFRKIRFFNTTPTAKRLHKELYGALAAGDITTISNITTDGLRNELKTKIQSRPRGWTYEWTLHGYSGIPRVISHRATVLPMRDGAGRRTSLRQAVVRIRSRQSLRVLDRSGHIVPSDTQEMRTVTEYLVLQKRVMRGVDEDWKIWGTTQEAVVENQEELRDIMNPKLEV